MNLRLQLEAALDAVIGDLVRRIEELETENKFLKEGLVRHDQAREAGDEDGAKDLENVLKLSIHLARKNNRRGLSWVSCSEAVFESLKRHGDEVRRKDALPNLSVYGPAGEIKFVPDPLLDRGAFYDLIAPLTVPTTAQYFQASRGFARGTVVRVFNYKIQPQQSVDIELGLDLERFDVP